MTRPTDAEIASVIRRLSDYANGHELRGQWAKELSALKNEAERIARVLAPRQSRFVPVRPSPTGERQ